MPVFPRTAALVLLLVGCGGGPPPRAPDAPAGASSAEARPTDPASECADFIGIVNETMTGIDRVTSQPPDENPGDAMRALSRLYADLASDLGERSFQTTDLARYAERYRAMATKAAAAAKKVADAVDAGDVRGATSSTDTFEEVVTEEGDLVANVNALCDEARAEQGAAD